MRYFLLVFLFLSTVSDGLKKASRINQGVKKAESYYHQQAYEQAIIQYQFLRNSLKVKDDALLLNLAHATYRTGDLATAKKYYNHLRNNPDINLQEAALNQLGLISFKEGNAEKALYYFRNAVIKNPLNETARFNYELLKKYQANHPNGLPSRPSGPKRYSENQNTPNPKTGKGVSAADAGQTDFISDLEKAGQEPVQNKPQNGATAANQEKNKPGKNSENQLTSPGNNPTAKGNQPGNTEGLQDEEATEPLNALSKSGGNEESTAKERQLQTLRKRLSNTSLSPEKAMLLLEAMQNAELQYLQQVPRPPSRPREKNKPDW